MVGPGEKALTGLRVLDLSANIAGPFCTMILADLGADVVKIERPDGGDETRQMPPHHEGESAVFAAMNRNKRSVVLDLKTDLGCEALLHLAREVDVVVQSSRPGTTDRLGVGFEALAAVNASFVYCSISAFGNTLSADGLPGYDPLIQAFTGLMSMTGNEGAPPARVAASVIDLTTGMWAAMGVLAALRQREENPGHRKVEATLVDSGFILLLHQLAGMTATGSVPGPLGSGSPITAPYEAFQTADGWVMVAAGNDHLFARLCRALGLDALPEDPRFATPTDRVGNRDALHALVGAPLAASSTENCVQLIAAAGVPVGRVNDLAEGWSHPIVVERSLRLESAGTENPTRFALVRLPIDDGRGTLRRMPPRHGEHTAEVLVAAGFPPDRIGRLLAEGNGHSRPSVRR
jgi:crotonobetainyl-CoA:carnitine CoA-transferase CaiB-like acyl-CoA transferase